MDITVKKFKDLQNQELYYILQLRSAVFVVEQNCVYQDLDGKDFKALHVIGTKKGELVAYTRIFKAGKYLEYASIGRVLVKESARKYGYGKDILSASITAIATYFNESRIQLSAQCYLQRFYNSLGFIAIGESYLEDGIPHILMEKR
ncbi:GNAT family N-acetyltransferase [Arenibacter sp. GZD96]|uniref:GNAT family N-acetyltransferase n=1 Tax=Aurantibrevibacter litoralis TaxID=3106030 RepID=UPI002B0018A0|nr:GNAT family N-acetyltransferase [Arenibacter sp. GZD-96]MEA1785721.1 GNAT family N-acetyltransferase [Arenibacter sp. GZD-96]